MNIDEARQLVADWHRAADEARSERRAFDRVLRGQDGRIHSVIPVRDGRGRRPYAIHQR